MKKTSCCCCSPSSSSSLPMMIFSKKKNSKSTLTSGDSSLFVLAKTTTATRAVTALRDDEYLSSSLFFAHRWFMVCVHTLYNLREKILEECLSRRKRMFSITRAQSENCSRLSSEIFWPLSPPPIKKKLFSLSKARACCVLLPPIVSSLSLFQRINQISLHLRSRRNSIALFYKGVFIYQNTLLSLLYYSHRGIEERERESRKRKYSLSLKKRDRGLNPSRRDGTIKEGVCVRSSPHERIYFPNLREGTS